jgi:hypothetical protein
VCVEKEISYFSFPPDFVPKYGGPKRVIFFLFVYIFFQVPVSCPSHLAYLVLRYSLMLIVFENDSVALSVSPFGLRLLRAMPSTNKAILLSWQ